MQESEEELLLILFNTGYLARKISDDVEETILAAAEAQGSLDLDSLGAVGGGYTGLLLGLCTPGQGTGSRQNDRYRTLWLALENQRLAPVLETEGIIFPRKKGFYRLKVVAGSGGEKEGDLLIAADMTDRTGAAEARAEGLGSIADSLRRSEEQGYQHRRIRYIGNDYLSLEETPVPSPAPASGGGGKEGQLSIIPVDGLPELKAVTISDLAGPGAARAMEQGRSGLLRQLGLEQAGQMDQQLDEENFGLVREMGYWTFHGRLSCPEGGMPKSVDFGFDVIPPSHVVFYNKLHIPWPRVKNYVPGAVDAFTSPNMDLALIVTRSELLVYGMFQGSLAVPPLERIPLQEGEEIIMAEWALGQYYVENWAATFQTCLAAPSCE